MPEMAIQTSLGITPPLTKLKAAYRSVYFAVARKWRLITPASWAYRRLFWDTTVSHTSGTALKFREFQGSDAVPGHEFDHGLRVLGSQPAVTVGFRNRPATPWNLRGASAGRSVAFAPKRLYDLGLPSSCWRSQ